MLKPVNPDQIITSSVDGYTDGRTGKSCAQPLNSEYLDSWLDGMRDRCNTISQKINQIVEDSKTV